jgi:uncharacterized membrane protein
MGIKFLSVAAAVLIAISVVLKLAISRTYRFGVGSHYYRLDYAFWALLLGGIALGLIAVLKAIARAKSG